MNTSFFSSKYFSIIAVIVIISIVVYFMSRTPHKSGEDVVINGSALYKKLKSDDINDLGNKGYNALEYHRIKDKISDLVKETPPLITTKEYNELINLLDAKFLLKLEDTVINVITKEESAKNIYALEKELHNFSSDNPANKSSVITINNFTRSFKSALSLKERTENYTTNEPWQEETSRNYINEIDNYIKDNYLGKNKSLTGQLRVCKTNVDDFKFVHDKFENYKRIKTNDEWKNCKPESWFSTSKYYRDTCFVKKSQIK